MALTDVNFQEAEGQDFILEIPNNVYSGSLSDFLLEENGGQYLLIETPEVQGGGGGNIFIMSE